MKTRRTTFLLAGALSFLAVTLSYAEERTEESFIPNFAVASSYYSWTSEADFSNSPGSFSQSEFGIDFNAPVIMRDGFRLTAGIKYRRNALDFTGAPLPLGTQDLDLHRLDIPFNVWKDINQRWKLWLRLAPGFYTDFENVDSDDFILTSLALLSYRWTDTTKVAFGAFYSRDLGEERVLPALGFIFEPDEHWSVALTFPRVEVAYAPNPDLLFTGRAVLSGSGWNITNPNGGPDVDLNYRGMRLGVGVDKRIDGPWWAYVDAGIEVAREIEVDNGGVTTTQDIENAAFVTGGVKLRF